MTTLQDRATALRPWFVLLLVCVLVGAVAAQHKPSTPSTPHTSAPAPHVSAPASRPQSSRPSTPNHTGPMTSRPNNMGGARPGNGPNRPGTVGNRNGNFSRPGNGTVGKGNGMSRPGTMGRNGVANSRGTMTGRNGTGSTGRSFNRPLPGRQVSLRGGGSASLRPNGQIRSINRNGMQISHGLNGSRRIESVHNGARVVSTGKNSGYVQRAYVTRNGRTYVSRTVVVNHVTSTSVYRSYSYHGYCCYYGYHPAFYYAPVYYGWAYNPWPAPVYYGWGWGGAPWYGYYGAYFAPYPVYPSAAFWLTDYIIAANLQAAYAAQAQMAAGGGGGGGAAAGGGGDNGQGDQQAQGGGNDNSGSNSGQVALSPEVKQAIADEVKAQIAAEQASSNQGSSNQGSSNQGSSDPGQASQSSNDEVPPALDPVRRTFVVANDMTLNVDGQECQLTQGDVITRVSDQPDQDRNVTVSVAASRKSECGVGKQAMVSVDDLQEMYNHFQEQIDNGIKDLASKQGSNGLPKAPDTKTTPSDVPPPPPDNSAAKALEDQQQAADQTEAQVVKEAFSQGS